MASNLHKASAQAKQFILTSYAPDGAPVPSAPSLDDAPPPYTTLPTGGAAAVAATSELQRVHEHVTSSPVAYQALGAGVMTSGQQRRKLGYMDFMPQMKEKRLIKDNKYETFSELVDRANAWLQEHSWVHVLSCETIVWRGMRSQRVYSEQSHSERSLHAAQKTRHLMGLRLWFDQDAFPHTVNNVSACARVEHSVVAPAIECHTFVPRHDQEQFQQMIDRVNAMLETKPLQGKLFSAEVVTLPCKQNAEYRSVMFDTQLCFWKEDAEHDKLYVTCLRLYVHKSVGDVIRKQRQTIGYRDFVPEYNGRSKENKGYEAYSDVMDRASRWIGGQESVQFLSLRSINVKLKKKEILNERCVYREHLCALHRENLFTGISSSTLYLRIIRVFYVITQHSDDAIVSDTPGQSNIGLTSRAFMPKPLVLDIARDKTTSVTSSSQDRRPVFEEQKRLVERVNQWLSITDAKLFHVETVCLRQTSNTQLQSYGPDATFSQNALSNARNGVERWVHYVRLYLDGVYREPPSAICLLTS